MLFSAYSSLSSVLNTMGLPRTVTPSRADENESRLASNSPMPSSLMLAPSNRSSAFSPAILRTVSLASLLLSFFTLANGTGDSSLMNALVEVLSMFLEVSTFTTPASSWSPATRKVRVACTERLWSPAARSSVSVAVTGCVKRFEMSPSVSSSDSVVLSSSATALSMGTG